MWVVFLCYPTRCDALAADRGSETDSVVGTSSYGAAFAFSVCTPNHAVEAFALLQEKVMGLVASALVQPALAGAVKVAKVGPAAGGGKSGIGRLVEPNCRGVFIRRSGLCQLLSERRVQCDRAAARTEPILERPQPRKQ